MYTLKSTLKRGMTLSAGFGLVVASLATSITPAFADALNPLTDRSLTLSSSSPGWANTDGSGNSTYAPPNSGANGEKTGNYFDFKVSSTDTVKTMTFQYCTTSAGDCFIPGDMTVSSATPDYAGHKADLNVKYTAGNNEIESDDFDTVVDSSNGSVKAVPGYENNNPKYTGTPADPAEAATDVEGHYIVMYYDDTEGEWVQSTGWTVGVANVNDDSDTRTTNNYITLTNSAGVALTSGTQVKVLFFATDTDYITNPGSGAFFVKINTYKAAIGDDRSDYDSGLTGSIDLTDLAPVNDDYIIDGGVTVANVMNQSIQITTKVLETMQFSVGTVDPNTLDSTGGATGGSGDGSELWKATYDGVDSQTGYATHGVCDPILMAKTRGDTQNVLPLGNQNAESSLETAKTYATHSYWRLSSNSSAGATVYYSGHTLSNTVGDEIAPIGATADIAHPGTEQFGLAIANGDGLDHTENGLDDTINKDFRQYPVNYTSLETTENGADTGTAGTLGVHPSVTTDMAGNGSYHSPRLFPLVPTAQYIGGTLDDQSVTGLPTAYAFNPMSDTVPEPIASESSQVVDCVTAKMRYIANIAATTPAGIYTTKINYIAAPQY